MMEWVDEDGEPDAALRALTNRIIGCAIAVHKQVGPGFPEAVYQRAMELEMVAGGLKVQAQAPIRVLFRGEIVGEGRADFIVEELVVVELKAVDALHPVHAQQVLSYLRATGLPLGLLFNFNETKLINGLRRIAATKPRE